MEPQSVDTWPALSLRQPWAELLLSGRKTIELRQWSSDYRGRLWLHVSSKPQPDLERQFGLKNAFRGGFAGSIKLSAIVPLTPERWTQWHSGHLDDGPYQEGLFAWIMEAPHRFLSPVKGKGQLRLFQPSADTFQQLRAAELAM